jgi:hypothetical protein
LGWNHCSGFVFAEDFSFSSGELVDKQQGKERETAPRPRAKSEL